MFSEFSKSELDDIFVECYADTRKYAKVMHPEMFSSPFSELHDKIFELIDSDAPRVAIAAPRGLGKTTIASTYATKCMLYRSRYFVPYVSNSATMASMQSDNIKRELLSNQDIRSIFGNVKTASAKESGFDESFSKEAWVGFDTLILPRGAQQQVRGILWNSNRPDLIIIDDLEKKDELMNEENRIKLKSWFYSDLLKCIDRYKKNFRIIYIDTIKHEDSLLEELLASSDWESTRLSVCDEDYKSLAPEYISDAELKEEVESHREKGQLDVFYMEYMNLPISLEDASFKNEHFKHYDPPLDLEIRKKLEFLVIVDPAKTVKLQAADSAIVGAGLDLAGNRIYIEDIVAGKMYPDELYNEMLGMCARLGAKVLGVEVTSLNEFITQPIRNEIIKRGIFVELVELKARAKKEERIGWLSPWYRQGYIYHNRNVTVQLEAQLLFFPRSKRLDVADATAYIIEMMEHGERYFTATRFEDDPEAEYKELEEQYEPPLMDWMLV